MVQRSYLAIRFRSRGGMVALGALIISAAAIAIGPPAQAADLTTQRSVSDRYFLPTGAQAKIVSVVPSPKSLRKKRAEGIVVMTERVAVNETGPAATVKKFGETYAWSPRFITVRRDEPLRLAFWNLQPDDEHDFMLLDPEGNPLMHQRLLPLSTNAWTFTFHREGIFDFLCAAHQPEMTGQILVLPPQRGK